MSASSPASRVRANLQELFEGNVRSGTPHVKFQLTSQVTALLSMEQIQESLIVKASQITPLPSTLKSVIGMMNSGDRVFYVFDLAELLSLTSTIFAPQHYQILVLQTTGENPIYIGFAVTYLQGIIRITQENIRSAEIVADPKIIPFIRGAISEQEGILPILDFDRVLNAASQN